MRSKELFSGVFSRHAEAYNARHALIRRSGASRGRQRLLERLALRGDESVLDLCCGPGNLGAELLEHWPQVRLVGADLAPGMLSVAAATLPSVGFVLADAEALPFRAHAFGSVACGHGLQFCPDLPAVLREVRRVLSPDGVLAASVPHLGRSSDRAQAVLDQLLPPFPDTPDRAGTLAVVADAERFAQAARDAGFAEAAVEEVAGDVVWATPREMFQQSFGWWSCAVRLEGVEPSRRDALLEEAVAIFEAENGSGPVSIPGSDLVLSARR